MKALAALLLFLAALPALARPPGSTPVVVPREEMQRRLSHAHQLLSEAIGRLQKHNKVIGDPLRGARAELDELREMLAAAPHSKAVEEGQRMMGGLMHGTMNTIDRELEADRRERHDRDRREVVIIHKTEAPPPPPPPPPAPAQPVVYPIQEGPLQALTAAIEAESFPRDRLRVLDQAAPTSWFLVGQVQQLLTLFDFPRDRLAAARQLKPRILDPENFFLLYGSFEFPSDKAELKKILGK